MKVLAAALTLTLAPPPPVVDTSPRRQVMIIPPGPERRMITAGIVLTATSIAAYGVLAAGLGLGGGAEDALFTQHGRDDLPRRREIISRGRLGNILAITGGVSAAVLMGAGVALVVVGRRRAQNRFSLRAGPGAAGVIWSGRF